MSDPEREDPHGGQPVRTAGAPLAQAQAAVIMVHGRGASAEDILSLAPALGTPGVAFLAPQAGGSQGRQWYPLSFMAPIERNEPGISSGLPGGWAGSSQVAAAGITPEQTLLLGFSQGACRLGFRGPPCPSVWRPRGAERRADRARRRAANLPGLARRHAGVPRLQRHRFPHPGRASRAERRGAPAARRRGHHAAVSRHGPPGERRRDRDGAGHDCPGRGGPGDLREPSGEGASTRTDDRRLASAIVPSPVYPGFRVGNDPVAPPQPIRSERPSKASPAELVPRAIHIEANSRLPRPARSSAMEGETGAHGVR